ncbi:MAG: hypothetical protein AAF939_05205 [Planctomycetota bacterium]
MEPKQTSGWQFDTIRLLRCTTYFAILAALFSNGVLIWGCVLLGAALGFEYSYVAGPKVSVPVSFCGAVIGYFGLAWISVVWMWDPFSKLVFGAVTFILLISFFSLINEAVRDRSNPSDRL